MVPYITGQVGKVGSSFERKGEKVRPENAKRGKCANSVILVSNLSHGRLHRHGGSKIWQRCFYGKSNHRNAVLCRTAIRKEYCSRHRCHRCPRRRRSTADQRPDMLAMHALLRLRHNNVAIGNTNRYFMSSLQAPNMCGWNQCSHGQEDSAFPVVYLALSNISDVVFQPTSHSKN